ncbi:uracil-DNA glycosylase family protein [Thermodesulfobacteriota bacterium]
MAKKLQTKTVLKRLGSAKFALGLNPWLDRCMLYRKSRKTKLMIIGIDYKHFPVFHGTKRDHNFPLDSYRIKNNIWGPTWRNFWKQVLSKPYDDSKVDTFIGEKGVFITNSMLCFGGSVDPRSHFYGYLECCRPYIREMISIVRPEIIVSFGNFGCRNAASILAEENRENQILNQLAKSNAPLKLLPSILRKREFKGGIKTIFNRKNILFWPLYQPARSNVCKYPGDYRTLTRLLDLAKGGRL